MEASFAGRWILVDGYVAETLNSEATKNSWSSWNSKQWDLRLQEGESWEPCFVSLFKAHKRLATLNELYKINSSSVELQKLWRERNIPHVKFSKALQLRGQTHELKRHGISSRAHKPTFLNTSKIWHFELKVSKNYLRATNWCKRTSAQRTETLLKHRLWLDTAGHWETMEVSDVAASLEERRGLNKQTQRE